MAVEPVTSLNTTVTVFRTLAGPTGFFSSGVAQA
jgi:hypothetical protein